VLLPTTGIFAGQRFTLVNNSTGAVTVNASGGATKVILEAGATLVLTANQATPTLPAHWAITGGTSFLAQRPNPNSLWAAGSAESYSRQGSLVGYALASSGFMLASQFVAPVANTITKLGFGVGNTPVSAGLTLARLGLYTVAANGDMTLVARTASDTTMGNTALSLYQAALNTTGGYPASYTYIPGQRYAHAIINVGTTMTPIMGQQTESFVNTLAPVTVRNRFSETDLAASYSGGTSATNGWWYNPWMVGLA
jgi:hypothetical protein